MQPKSHEPSLLTTTLVLHQAISHMAMIQRSMSTCANLIDRTKPKTRPECRKQLHCHNTQEEQQPKQRRVLKVDRKLLTH